MFFSFQLWSQWMYYVQYVFPKKGSKNISEEEKSVRILNGLNFESEILNKKGTSLVEFYAEWNHQCSYADCI